MVVGENSRAEDMDVNICRGSTSPTCGHPGPTTQKLTPPTRMSLERALEFLANDECVEVTPSDIRLRRWCSMPAIVHVHSKAMKAARS